MTVATADEFVKVTGHNILNQFLGRAPSILCPLIKLGMDLGILKCIWMPIKLASHTPSGNESHQVFMPS